MSNEGYRIIDFSAFMPVNGMPVDQVEINIPADMMPVISTVNGTVPIHAVLSNSDTTINAVPTVVVDADGVSITFAHRDSLYTLTWVFGAESVAWAVKKIVEAAGG